MRDDWIEEELSKTLRHIPDRRVPEFASVLQRAEQRHARGARHYRLVAAVAVIASVAAVTLVQWPNREEAVEDEFLIASSLLETTQWVAPSDVLLPQHQFDIYRDMPVFMRSTDAEKGTLL
ncbi:MAG: hypothetical protein GXP15_04805 [Gammaproteobacteria bacterium]|nr:hypothetical protein [Gammaproteobacteria bacterium]